MVISFSFCYLLVVPFLFRLQCLHDESENLERKNIEKVSYGILVLYWYDVVVMWDICLHAAVLYWWVEPRENGSRIQKNNKNVCNFLLLSLMLCCYLHVMMSQPWVEGRLYLSLIPFVQLTPLVDCCACGCCWCLAVCCYLMPINRWCRQFAFISDVAQLVRISRSSVFLVASSTRRPF